MLLAMVASASHARADEEAPGPRARAQALFEEGVHLLERGDYAAACARFAESHALAPAGGTALDLGYCHEKQGHMASALTAYEDALARARAANRADRVRVAEAHVDALRRRVSRLRIRFEPSVSAFEALRVEIDGEALADPTAAVPVDGGAHAVSVRANGRAPLEQRVEVQSEGASVEIVVEGTTAAKLARPEAPSLATHALPPPPRRSKALPTALGVTGAALVGVGAVTGAIAFGYHLHSNSLCDHANTCRPGGAKAEDTASTFTWISTGGFGTGLAFVGVAAYMLFTAPHEARATAADGGPLTLRF